MSHTKEKPYQSDPFDNPLKLVIVFNWNKRIIWAYIVSWKKGDGFSFFLKAFETDLLVTLGDFTVKKRKIGKGNLFLTENRFSKNEIWCAVVYRNQMRHIMCKTIFRFQL